MNREKKFQKGPWKSNKDRTVTRPDGQVICSFDFRYGNMNDIHLMAASRELLEALEFQCLRCRADIAKHNALSDDKQDTSCGDCVCGRAIAKAYGEVTP